MGLILQQILDPFAMNVGRPPGPVYISVTASSKNVDLSTFERKAMPTELRPVVPIECAQVDYALQLELPSVDSTRSLENRCHRNQMLSGAIIGAREGI